MKGIAIRTDFDGIGSFVKIASDLYTTAHWRLNANTINPGETEIALFRNGHGDSFICGTVVALIARDYDRDGELQERKIVVFEMKDKVVGRHVFTESMNLHRYEMDGGQYVEADA